MLAALVVFYTSGCASMSEMATALASDAIATMPDPSTVNAPCGITATQFWSTWGATLLIHEGRKLFRDLFGKKTKGE